MSVPVVYLSDGRLMVRTRDNRTTLSDIPGVGMTAGMATVWGTWEWTSRGALHRGHRLVAGEAKGLDWPRERDAAKWSADMAAAVERLGRVEKDLAEWRGR